MAGNRLCRAAHRACGLRPCLAPSGFQRLALRLRRCVKLPPYRALLFVRSAGAARRVLPSHGCHATLTPSALRLPLRSGQGSPRQDQERFSRARKSSQTIPPGVSDPFHCDEGLLKPPMMPPARLVRTRVASLPPCARSPSGLRPCSAPLFAPVFRPPGGNANPRRIGTDRKPAPACADGPQKAGRSRALFISYAPLNAWPRSQEVCQVASVKGNKGKQID